MEQPNIHDEGMTEKSKTGETQTEPQNPDQSNAPISTKQLPVKLITPPTPSPCASPTNHNTQKQAETMNAEGEKNTPITEQPDTTQATNTSHTKPNQQPQDEPNQTDQPSTSNPKDYIKKPLPTTKPEPLICNQCDTIMHNGLRHHLKTSHLFNDVTITIIETSHPTLFTNPITHEPKQKRQKLNQDPQDPEPTQPLLPAPSGNTAVERLSPQCPSCETTGSPNAKILHFLRYHTQYFTNQQVHKLTNHPSILSQDLPLRNPSETKPNNRRSKCTLCQTKFKTPQHLHNHVIIMHTSIIKHFQPVVQRHHECRLQRCTLCDQSFYWIENLRLHVQSSHRTARTTRNLWQYICPKLTANNVRCPTFTIRADTMVDHIRDVHHTITDFNSLNRETRPTPLIPFYKCNVCHISFHTTLDLFDHTNTAHRQQTMKISSNRQRLLNITPYQCNACCESRFLDMGTLIQHQQKQQETPNRFHQGQNSHTENSTTTMH